MDHGNMDHGDMGHGGSGDGMDDMCSMNMLFTWSPKNLCVVFKWWHVRSQFDFILTFAAVVLLGMGYEYIKSLASKVDELSSANKQQSLLDSSPTNSSSYSNTNPEAYRVRKSILYGVQVFYSFFLMLVFMTYNGWMMIAVTLGAMLGYYVWGYRKASKREMTCH